MVKWFKYPSVIPLIIANLFPVLGVLFLGWNINQIMFLYWLETFIIYFFSVAKILFLVSKEMNLGEIVGKLMIIPLLSIFFLFFASFQGFMLAWIIFRLDFVVFFNINRLLNFLINNKALFNDVILALFILLISHYFSFVSNYVQRAEWKKATVAGLAEQPFLRVFLIYIVLDFGGLINAILGPYSNAFLILFVFSKIVIDVIAHTSERERFSTVAKLD